MWITELRGLIVVAVVAGLIALAWTAIESRPVAEVGQADTPTTTVSSATTTTTTTLSPEEANQQICELAGEFAEVGEAASLFGDGPVAVLALDFWREIGALASGSLRVEIGAVVTYYEDYLETAEPFDFDVERIIVEGDKEKLEQLITRPAPGLEESLVLISLCGVEIPDQPTMGVRDFERLEDKLLDD